MFRQINFTISKLILSKIKPELIIIGFSSFFINIITIICSFYSMQIFDKVLSSSSLETLLYLTIIAIIMAISLKIFGVLRVNSLLQIAQIIHNILNKKIRLLNNRDLEYQLFRQLNKILENFLNNAIFNLIDIVFSLGYLLVIFLISPWLALFSILALGCLFVTEKYFNKKTKILNNKQIQLKESENISKTPAKNLNLSPIIIDESQYFQGLTDCKKLFKYRNLNFKINSHFLTIFKNLRLIIQILTTAFSAVLIIKNQISIGSLIAVSILISRFLEPFFAIENNLKNLYELKKNYQDLLLKISQDLEIEKIDFKSTKFSQITFKKILVQNQLSPIQSIEIEDLEINIGNLIAYYYESNFHKNLLPNLLLNRLKPLVGSIEINGYNFTKINQDQIAKLLCIIDDNQLNIHKNVYDFIEDFDSLNSEIKKILTNLKIVDEYKNITSQNFCFDDISNAQKKLLLFIKKISNSHHIIFLESPFGSANNAKLLEMMHQYCRQNHLTLIFFNPALGLQNYFDKIIVAKSGFINGYSINEFKKIYEKN